MLFNDLYSVVKEVSTRRVFVCIRNVGWLVADVGVHVNITKNISKGEDNCIPTRHKAVLKTDENIFSHVNAFTFVAHDYSLHLCLVSLTLPPRYSPAKGNRGP